MDAVKPKCEGDKCACGGVVSGSGGGGKGSLEVGSHICCEGSDVGVGVGSGEASGARDRNSCMRKRERESAIELSTPGMCLAVV